MKRHDIQPDERTTRNAELTTLCYIEHDGKYLMLHRVKKKQDINQDKWIGVGGHFKADESPEECLLREVREETGITLRQWEFRGLVTFVSGSPATQPRPEGERGTAAGCLEYMALYTAGISDDEAEAVSKAQCREGDLEWIDKADLWNLNLWEGDKIFFLLLESRRQFFSLKLVYSQQGVLQQAVLDGRNLELLDLLDEKGEKTGVVCERTVAHRLGYHHATVHMWVLRGTGKNTEVLLQKRSKIKDSSPGCWDISSAGHISAGADRLPSAVRELHEELGIMATESDLKEIGFTDRKMTKLFYGQPWIDNQISYIYIYRKPIEAEELRLQESEVESVKWMKLKDVIKNVQREDPDFPNCLNPEELEMLDKAIMAGI